MVNHVCNFKIAGGGNGGRLQGDGFGKGEPPSLGPSDTLQVIVEWNGNGAPASLNGYFVFSSAPLANSTQVAPSPFVDNSSNYICFATLSATGTAGAGNKVTFSFPVMTYAGNRAGKYELTFIAQSGIDTSATQWSADPEFDTSN